MKISEKQMLTLISFSNYAIEADYISSKVIDKMYELLITIHDQQSDELKELE